MEMLPGFTASGSVWEKSLDGKLADRRDSTCIAQHNAENTLAIFLSPNGTRICDSSIAAANALTSLSLGLLLSYKSVHTPVRTCFLLCDGKPLVQLTSVHSDPECYISRLNKTI
jgi:hypothetical protein